MTTSNYVYQKGTLFVARGGGSAPEPLTPGAANQALFANPASDTGVEWGSGSAMGNVVGPVSSTAHHLAAFADTTGELLEDSGLLTASVAIGAGSSTAGHLVSFDSTDGKTMADSGIAAALVALGVAGPVVASNFSAFNGTGGKQLKDSGFSQSSFVQTIRGTAVDMTAAAATTIFTPATDFVLLGVIQYAVTITGSVTAPVFNLGFTSSTYDDYVDAFTTTNAATGNFTQVFQGITGPFPVIPASTPLKVNVTTADSTASVDSQRFDVIGYYV